MIKSRNRTTIAFHAYISKERSSISLTSNTSSASFKTIHFLCFFHISMINEAFFFVSKIWHTFCVTVCMLCNCWKTETRNKNQKYYPWSMPLCSFFNVSPLFSNSNMFHVQTDWVREEKISNSTSHTLIIYINMQMILLLFIRNFSFLPSSSVSVPQLNKRLIVIVIKCVNDLCWRIKKIWINELKLKIIWLRSECFTCIWVISLLLNN